MVFALAWGKDWSIDRLENVSFNIKKQTEKGNENYSLEHS